LRPPATNIYPLAPRRLLSFNKRWNDAMNTARYIHWQDGEILAGKMPSQSEVKLHLVIAAMDARAMTDGDPKSSWTERRISRQNLGLSFLVAIPISGGSETTHNEP
jgi:hypothetical protein